MAIANLVAVERVSVPIVGQTLGIKKSLQTVT